MTMTPDAPGRGAHGGLFITLEGGEGAGKSTQACLLGRTLEDLGHKVVLTREPGGAPGAEDIRSLIVTGEPGRWTPMSETLLFATARQDHVERTIRPALAAGAVVICDRFSDSTMAYQGYGHGLPLEDLHRINDFATGGLKPDLTLILDVPVDEGLGRAGRRISGFEGEAGEDRFERMGGGFHERLRQGFLAIADREPHRCRVIDGAQPLDAVARDIAHAVKGRLPSAPSAPPAANPARTPVSNGIKARHG